MPTWLMRFDGPASDGDRAWDVAVADDGSIYTVGFAYYQTGPSSAAPRLQLVKYAPDGTEIWDRSYSNGTLPSRGRHVAIDADGNIVTVGALTSSDPLTVKWAPDGTQLWARGTPTFAGALVEPTALALADNGDILVVAQSTDLTRVRVIRYDASGALLWDRFYTANGLDSLALAIALDDAGAIYLAGTAFDPVVSSEFVVWKLDSAGNLLWTRITGDPAFPGGRDRAWDIAIDDDGNAIAVGEYRYNTVPGGDVAVLKYAPDGTLLWDFFHTRPDDGWDRGEKIRIDGNGDLVVAISYAISAVSAIQADGGCMKLRPDGTFVWSVDFGGMDYDFIEDMTLGADGAAYLVGTFGINTIDEAALTAKVSADGVVEWVDMQQGDFSGNATAVANGPGGSIIVVGEGFYSGVNNDMITMRYDIAITGDLNCDGLVSVGDIGAFVLALTEPDQYLVQFPDCDIASGDCSGDGIVSVGDIGCFVSLLTGG